VLRPGTESAPGQLHASTWHAGDGRSSQKAAGLTAHPLTGDLAGYWSLTVTRNWRLVFRFKDGDASDLDLMDYH
jgi:hypothetical protein